jgi:hypothetical protein
MNKAIDILILGLAIIGVAAIYGLFAYLRFIGHR